jgi:hypothetical protein
MGKRFERFNGLKPPKPYTQSIDLVTLFDYVFAWLNQGQVAQSVKLPNNVTSGRRFDTPWRQLFFFLFFF